MRWPAILLTVSGLVATAVSFRIPEHGAVVRADNPDPTQIFITHCVSCHGSSDPAAGLDLSKTAALLAESYVVARGDPENSLVIKRVTGKIMPQMPAGGAPLSDADVQILRDWIKSLQPDPTSIFATRCAMCHGGDHPAAGLNLTKTAKELAQISQVVRGDPDGSTIMKRITGKVTPQMPPGGSPLSDSDIHVVRSWIAGLNDPRPIFNARCMPCHSPNRHAGGLNLAKSLKDLADSSEVAKGDADNSPIVQRITGTVGRRMPPGGTPLSDEDVGLVKLWISGLRAPNTQAAH